MERFLVGVKVATDIFDPDSGNLDTTLSDSFDFQSGDAGGVAEGVRDFVQMMEDYYTDHKGCMGYRVKSRLVEVVVKVRPQPIRSRSLRPGGGSNPAFGQRN